MKLLPIGIADFKEIMESNCYYIDKTQWIEELLQDGAKVKLFTRPRRFGKTLNMSMLQYFWDISNKEENRKLFQGLKIENSPYMEEQGKYPVIFLSLKDIKTSSFSTMIHSIQYLISVLFDKFSFLSGNLKNFEALQFKKLLFGEANIVELQNSIKLLSKILTQYYNRKTVILLDEYDSPIVSAYEHGYYEEAISFFRTFYSAALKDNEYLHKGIMTGILRVAKEGIFSGLNNLAVYSILDEKYSSSFGLTETEVEKALEYYELEYNMEKVKEWYDGYLFGNTEIYNPWSILNYISNQKLEAYWVNTSNNFLVYDVLEKANMDIFEELQAVFQGKEIQKTLDYSFSFQELKNPQEIWQLLVHSGYLKTEKNMGDHKYLLKIPNQEIHHFFEKSFLNRFLGGVDHFHTMLSALKQGEIAIFEKKLQDILLSHVSYYDVGQEEKYYHNLVLGMILSLSKEYEIHSNVESGYGRYDIALEPRERTKAGFVLECKLAKSEEELERKAQEALQQIEEKQYEVALKERGISKLIKLGLAFCGKKVKVISKF
ncbi:9-O-acetyl-N-acetylneuraminate esterase [Fusobacterium necrophorum subsp. funduliforme]|nr:9-O-acetyl-N-acetylneuraminate esterase [Fusobacterium necrophorum subsp. funduliforme]KYM39991.1 9-O-acetyl-N-acetylneuraminate esterase [Fusobacterium necrophorum subsp. funduliforme]KYM50351.1 9-O-acetyl-N-acetylneuraminate esterase [Fusobacterium necrophorum subsp. funduliforme]KYM61466.1 9-O-acetyl-N-acetylneuraminate esterase [Fusobacterium necrophorum subsp. funduliforme]